MLTPLSSVPAPGGSNRSCRDALIEVESLLEMGAHRLDEARQTAPPAVRGAMADLVNRLRGDCDLIKTVAHLLGDERG